jgi:hypothetical protein
MQVGAADRGVHDFHDGIAGVLDLGLGPILDRLLSGTAIDESFNVGLLRLRAPPSHT